MGLTKIVKNLLIVNVIVFLLSYNFFKLDSDAIYNFLLFPMNNRLFHWHQFITYMFLHASISHIVLNMLALVSFGPVIEKKLGSKSFLLFYLICGVISGLAHITFSNSPILGASGAVWGLMALFALTRPDDILYLYFFIKVKAKYIIGVFFIIEMFLALNSSADGISHWGHVGGAVAGCLFYFYNKNKIK